MTHGKSKKDFKVLIVYPNLPLMLVPSIAIALFTRIFKEQSYRVGLFETTHYQSEEEASSEIRVTILNAREFDASDDLGVTMKTDMLGDFRRKVKDFEPDFMIYSVVEDAFLQAVSLLRSIEDLAIPHLIGGVFPTAAPERCFEHPEVKMIGLGEGERIVVSVAEAVRLGESLDTIPGTWHRDENGYVHKNGKDPLVDINDHCPDFSLFDESRFYRPMGGKIFKTLPVETYRGCPYSCAYCNSPMQRSFSQKNGLGNFLRRKTMGTLKGELTEYQNLYDPEFIYFVDDSFLARPRAEIFEFCDMYEDFGLPFWFNTRAENCDTEILKRLKEVGCYRMSFGLEAGNESYRQKVLLRKPTNAKILEHFEMIAESGIAFSLNLIIGMPGETRDLVMDTVELVRSVKGYDTLTVSTFTPYHGTELRTMALENNWLDPTIYTKHFTSRSLLKMPPPYLNADDIDGLVATFPLYCYFPKSEWDSIRYAETESEEGLKIREHYAAIYRREFLKDDQEEKQILIPKGGTGCRSNPKDSLRFAVE